MPFAMSLAFVDMLSFTSENALVMLFLVIKFRVEISYFMSFMPANMTKSARKMKAKRSSAIFT